MIWVEIFFVFLNVIILLAKKAKNEPKKKPKAFATNIDVIKRENKL